MFHLFRVSKLAAVVCTVSLLVSLLVQAPVALGQVNDVYVGGVDDQWDNPANWGHGYVPGDPAQGNPGDLAFIINLQPSVFDYNGNGTVDAADYTLWLDTFGSQIDLFADGDNSGEVDQADYDLWKANFGVTGAGNAAVVDQTVPTFGVAFVGQGSGDGLVRVVSGGNLTNTSSFILGQDSGRSGRLEVQGGSFNTPNLFVGNNTVPSSADFSGGAANIVGTVFVSANAGAAGSSVTQSNGTITADNFHVGENGAASYTMSGGTLTANNSLSPEFAGLSVGFSAPGTFNHSGGTVNNEASHLTVGVFGGTEGSAYNLSGTGVVNVNNGGFLIVGNSGVSSFNQSGGTVSVSNRLLVGRNGVGTYDISAGTVTATGSILVADSSTSGGSKVVQSGGTINTGAVLIGAGASGSFDHSGGTINAANIVVGAGDSGTYDQTGGTVATPRLDIGGDLAAVPVIFGTGVYNMSGGTFDATGGAVNTVAPQPGGTGTLNLSGTASFTGAALAVGDNLSTFDETLDGKTAGGDGTLTITGPDVAIDLGGVWIGETGTLEVNAGSTISTIVTTGVAATAGGTFLIGDLVLDLSTLASNADLTLINNTNNLAEVLGTFNGLPEGTTFADSTGTKQVTITYAGGVDSNDVLLTNITTLGVAVGSAIPEPSSLMLCIVLGILGCLRRRR